MALKETIHNMKNLLCKIGEDLHKSENFNKAASQRVRTNTIRLEKVAKLYRKESIKFEKQNKGKKRPAKAAAKKHAAKKPHGKKSAQKKSLNSKAKKKISTKPIALRRPAATLRRIGMR